MRLSDASSSLSMVRNRYYFCVRTVDIYRQANEAGVATHSVMNDNIRAACVCNMLSDPRIEVVFHSFRYATRRSLQGSCKDCYLRSHSFTQPEVRMPEPSHSSVSAGTLLAEGDTEDNGTISSHREGVRPGAPHRLPPAYTERRTYLVKLIIPPFIPSATCHFLEIPRVHCLLYIVLSIP